MENTDPGIQGGVVGSIGVDVNRGDLGVLKMVRGKRKTLSQYIYYSVILRNNERCLK